MTNELECTLKDDNKNALEDITGDTYSKNTNALNDKQSVTSVSTPPSIIHADYIIEEDVKSDDINRKPGCSGNQLEQNVTTSHI